MSCSVFMLYFLLFCFFVMYFTVRDHSFSTYAKLVRTCAYQGVRNACFSENFANVLNESCIMSLFLTCFGINVLQLSWRFSPLAIFQRLVHSFYYLNDDMSQIQWTILFLAWTEIWEEIKKELFGKNIGNKYCDTRNI